MSCTKGTVVFYGVDGIGDKLDKMIDDLNLKHQYFAVKLIVMEAVTNAFLHGENGKQHKPVYVCYELNGTSLTVEVKDYGCGFTKQQLPEEIDDNHILDEGGRGLFIINSYSDEVRFEKNSLIMKKNFYNEVAV